MSENGSETNASSGHDDESRALTPSHDGGQTDESSRASRLPLRVAIIALVVTVVIGIGGGYAGWRLWQQLGAVREQAAQAQAEAAQAGDKAQAATSRANNLVATSELDKRTKRLEQRLAERISALDQALAKVDERVGSRDTGVDDLRSRIEELASSQQSLDRRMSEIQEIARSSKDDWKRSEAAYLATIAVHRLRYYRDIDAALGALKASHELLSEFGGAHIEARKGVARAIDRLIEVDPPRIDRVRGRLAKLRDAVVELPVPMRAGRLSGRGDDSGSKNPDATNDGPQVKGKSWRERAGHAWQQFKGALGGLVTITREDKGPPLRTPKERFFLKQNLKLQIEAARLAALRGDQSAYDASVQRLSDWLDTYFGGNDPQVSAVRQRISQLNDARVSVDLPEIAPLVERVRSFE